VGKSQQIFNNFMVDPELERQYLLNMVRPHENLNFVRRLMKPKDYPVLPEHAGPGTFGTHLMSYSTDNKGAIAYPEIVQQSEGDPLKRLSRKDALSHAITNKQYIPFDSEQEAKFFGENYKKLGNTWNR
jgi:hypothetical protein